MKWIRCSERLPKEGKAICRSEHTAGVLSIEKGGCVIAYLGGTYVYIIGFRLGDKKLSEWEYLDETDNADEEKAFEAAREISDEILSNSYDSRKTYQKYETFQDYLKSKQK